MKITRASSEEEMISEFLKAEIDPRQDNRLSTGKMIKSRLADLKVPETIIYTPDLTRSSDNGIRKLLLTEIRGFPNQLLFTRVPTVVDWKFAELDNQDILNIEYLNQVWNTGGWLAGGAKAADGAAYVLKSTKNGLDNVEHGDFKSALHYIQANGQFLPVVLITDGNRVVVLEGHKRVTVYAMDVIGKKLSTTTKRAIVGTCSPQALKNWNG